MVRLRLAPPYQQVSVNKSRMHRLSWLQFNSIEVAAVINDVVVGDDMDTLKAVYCTAQRHGVNKLCGEFYVLYSSRLEF